MGMVKNWSLMAEAIRIGHISMKGSEVLNVAVQPVHLFKLILTFFVIIERCSQKRRNG